MNTPINGQPEVSIDVDALQKKYEEERGKRLRADAVDQYQHLAGAFAGFAEDPHVAPGFARAPLEMDFDVLVIGGGFAGLLAGSRLRQAGVKRIGIIEKGGDFGGTWYWNRYPCVACDVESYVYMPLLEELNYIPSEKYAKGTEIFAYCKKLANHFDLYRDAIFQTVATRLEWRDDKRRWLVQTTRNDRLSAQFVVSCTGLLSSPKLPGIPGIETFAGHSFHTSRWDYSYTGGNSEGNLTGLADKSVGVIGTGSTGIQCIPPLARSAKHLYIFQRTPSSINVRNNKPTDPKWAASLTPGWHRHRMKNFTSVTSGVANLEDLIDDGWTDIIRDIAPPLGGEGAPVDPKEMLRADMLKMERTRQRVANIVKDPATAEALKPYYAYFCKRPGFNDEYLDVFNQPNVTLVDTNGKGAERITPRGVVVAGREYPVDCLIYATGFDFMTEFTRESGLDIRGRDGVSLAEHWKDGARTLYGMQTRGFPNFFVMSLVQSGISINYMHIADEQTRHIAYIIEQAMSRHLASVEPTEKAENDWVDTIVKMSGPRRAFLESCTPTYFNYEGKRRRGLELNEPYGGGAPAYLKILEDWRAEGSMAGIESQG